MRDHRYSKWFHQRIGYIWQHPDSQLFCSSVREELAFGPVQMGLPSEDVKKRVDDALELLGLTKLADRLLTPCPAAKRNGRPWLHPDHESPNLTMDEPESYLDADGLTWLEDFLPSLKAAGKTLIVATHHAGIIQKIIDKEIFMKS